MGAKLLKIIADENIVKLDEYLDGIAEITYLAGRQISADDLNGADALLVRSVTKVNESLLAGSNIQFVGSCTIGTDHIDTDYLAANNICFANAPGCNANAVVDYVLAALFAIKPSLKHWQQSQGVIVGYGEVGSRLSKRLNGLGIEASICDPFKPQHDNATASDFAAADWISLHVPLTKTGSHPTHYLFDEQRLQSLKQGCLLINSSRGKVVDNQALLALLNQHKLQVVLDVYENEPRPSMELLKKLPIATPHIAGYSLQGKIAGTEQVVRALFDCFAIIEPVPDLLSATCVDVDASGIQCAEELIKQGYNIQQDALHFTQQYFAASDDEYEKVFDACRKNYPVRTEWAYQQLSLNADMLDIAKQLGFSV